MKELKPIKQEHNGPTPNYKEKIANLSKFLPDEEEYTHFGLPETLVKESGERINTADIDEGRLSTVTRGKIPMAPYVKVVDGDDLYKEGEKLYLK